MTEAPRRDGAARGRGKARKAVSTAPRGSRTMISMSFISRHAIGVLVFLVIAGWALFYVPTTPSYAIYQLKQAIDARDGATAATFVDFPSVVKNAGYEMLQQNSKANDVITALV